MTSRDDEDVFEGAGQSPGFQHRRSSSYISGGRDIGIGFDNHEEHHEVYQESGGTLTSPTPPPFSRSPSDSSGFGPSSRFHTWRQVIPTQDVEIEASRPSSRFALARRLEQMVSLLKSGEEIDEPALGEHVERMEQALTGRTLSANLGSPSQRPSSQNEVLRRRPFASPLRSRSDVPQHRRRSTMSLGRRSLSEVDIGLSDSPAPAVLKSRFSDLAKSVSRETEEAEKEKQSQQVQKEAEKRIKGANNIIAEANKLNEELTAVVNNLKARQEEAEHIHGLLIERAERAAQRIIFLQNRISYLEEELDENDDELQHLRICLKAVEIQLPPHPDKDLQRCIHTFRQDYQALKKKRVNRSSVTSFASIASGMSPNQDSPGPQRVETQLNDKDGDNGLSQPFELDSLDTGNAEVLVTPRTTQRLGRDIGKAECES